MVIDKKIAYVKKKELFEPLIPTIPTGLNPIVFIEDTREMWTCGTYFSIGYPSIEVSEESGSIKVTIGNSFFMMSTTGESISVRKGDGNRIILSSNALNRVDTDVPLEWVTADRKLIHKKSGTNAGTFGQSTNVNNASIFSIPNVTVDEWGHVTDIADRNVSIRDYVEQLTPSTSIGERNVLLAYSDMDVSESAQVRKANGMSYNDVTKKLILTGGLNSTGAVNVVGSDLTVIDGYIIGKLKGNVEGSATPKIHLSLKPEYGGSSLELYGHVKLQDTLNSKPNPSTSNTNINNTEITAIAASPLMVWNAIETAKAYADSILGANNAMLYKGALEAGLSTPGTYTPAADIGNTYVVTFGSGNYIDNVGYINGEPVEIGDLLICKESAQASNSSNWQDVKKKWTYVQTNTTGVVSGPSASIVGQLAIFNSTTGKLIKGLANGSIGQMMVIGSAGIPKWEDKPDRLNHKLKFRYNLVDFLEFDGHEEKIINFIAGDNMFITVDAQGNITLAADPDSDTVNTAGATNLINRKLFLIGAESQTTSPQTYSNQYVYVGTDNCLYSNGIKVSTEGHTHLYAGSLTAGGAALRIDLNPVGLLGASYGTYAGVLQDSTNGPIEGSWSNRLKILHNNESGYYTELAQAITGVEGLWHRRNTAGSITGWTPVIDKSNFHTYLDDTYIQKQTDPNQLKNFVRYSLEGGLTMNWTIGNATPTHVWGTKDGESGQSYIFSGDNIRAFANAVNRAGDTMTGTLKVTEIQTTGGNGLTMYSGTDWTYLGQQAGTTYIRSGATDVYHRKNGTDYKIWDANNDGSGSGLDADLLDGVQLIQKGGNNGVLRSWARGSYTTVNQYFGNGVVVVIDPKPTDSNELWANTAIFSIGDAAARNWQVAYGYGTDTIKARRISDGPTYNAWKTFAFLDSNVASATRADYPTGFTSKLSSATWGNQDGTFVTGWGGPSSADIQFRNNGGKLNVIIDGTFYQDEGRYKVLDTNNYSSTLDARYLLKGSSVIAGNNSSWLSFSNDAGGIGGTMGTNDQWRIYGRSTASNAGYLEIATGDDAAEPIYVRQYSGVFATLSRTLTLLDASGNTTMPGTATAGNFSTAGRYITSYTSGTWINSVTNAALTVNMGSTYGGIWCAPVKGGRVAMSVYPSSNNNIYLGYASTAQITAGTNSFTKQTYWNADDGIWRAGGYAKDGSSDTYVLLGGGGHATLSGLGGSHTHTIFRNNLMIKGTDGISDTASIHLALGDSDTGFRWISDGVAQIYANNTAIGQWDSTCMNWYKTPQVNGVAVSLTGHTHSYITSSGLRTATANGNTRGESGVRLYAAYNNGYPTTYGTVLHLHEGRGAAELLLGWSGTDGAHANNYVRSKRDNDSGAWSGWATIYTTANLDINNLTAKYLVNVAGISNLDSPNWYSNGDGYGISMNSYNGSASNQPSGGNNANSVLNICNTKHGTSGVYGWQIAFENHNILVRKWSAGSKTGWYTLWHSGNSNISDALLKSGGTMTGALNFANNTWNKVGDDVYIGDHNIANYLCIKANSGTTAGINFFNSSDGDIGKLTSANGTLQWKGTNVSLNGHTHDFINSKGNLNAQTGRTQNLGNVYSYNTVLGNTGGPTTYTSIIGFGRGAAGTVEIAGGWTSDMGLWYRALRDITDNWFGWVKVWDTKNFNPGDYVQLSRLKKARIPGEVVDLFVYKVGSYLATSTDYTTFKNQLFESNGRGKSSVTYQPSYASSTTYTVDLSDFMLAYNSISAYTNGMYTAGAGELESNRVGQSVGANSKIISGLEMPKHAHWFGHRRSDNANDRDVFGPDGGQNHSTDGTTPAGQGGNWRTGYSGNGRSKDWRPKTLLVFKMVYMPRSW